MRLIRKFYSLLFNIIAAGVPSWNMTLFYIKQKQNESYQSLENQKILRERQSDRLYGKSRVRIAIVDDKAYWVHNNQFYSSIIDDNGLISKEDAEVIDVFSMSQEEIDELLDILDNISY